MSKKTILVIYAGLVIVVIGILIIKKPWSVEQKAGQEQTQATSNTKSISEGSVTIEVTPVSLSKTAKTWDFDISLNTHSGDLGQDLAKIAVLVDDKGKIYQPLNWTGATPGGHHRQGVLSFEPISPRPSSIELIIKDVDGIPERKFDWKL